MADHSADTSAAATMKGDLDATKAGAAGTVTQASSGGGGGGDASAGSTLNGDTADGIEAADGSVNAPQGSGTDNAAATSGEEGGVRRANAQGSFYDDALAGADGAEEEPQDEEDEDVGQWERVAASDVKNIILQTLSPYFDDDVGGGAAVVPGVDIAVPTSAAGQSATKPGTGAMGGQQQRLAAAAPIEDDRAAEDTAQRYDHFKSEEWIALVCDGITERLVALGKPFKFVVHSMVMRKSGAGVHVCSSCYYAPTDGWLSHAHDLSAHLYAVVTVYWCAV